MRKNGISEEEKIAAERRKVCGKATDDLPLEENWARRVEECLAVSQVLGGVSSSGLLWPCLAVEGSDGWSGRDLVPKACTRSAVAGRVGVSAGYGPRGFRRG
jgi:hypothetical protein